MAIEDIVCVTEYTKERKLYRLTGQTGSGKTTRLLPMALSKCTGKPVIINVGMFAKYYPDYQEIKNQRDMREITNGFSLKCLYATLNEIAKVGYLIVFDKTLLSVELERFVHDLLSENGYEIEYHIKAVSREQSDAFLRKRMLEQGRIVSDESKDYFYEILTVGLEFLARVDNKIIAHVWSVDDELLYAGGVEGAVKALKTGRGE